MRAHTQTIAQRPQVSVKVNVDGLDWFQRLQRWFKSLGRRSRTIEPVSPYGTWDAMHEQFHPMKADAAVDIVAAQHGISWTSRIYSASI
jgi:hypothetical protein